MIALSQVGSVQIRASSLLTVTVEDWSGVRSIGRARRRRRQGHRQNIVHRIVPDPKVYTLPNGDMVCHPDTLDVISRKCADRARSGYENQYLNALCGRPA